MRDLSTSLYDKASSHCTSSLRGLLPIGAHIDACLDIASQSLASFHAGSAKYLSHYTLSASLVHWRPLKCELCISLHLFHIIYLVLTMPRVRLMSGSKRVRKNSRVCSNITNMPKSLSVLIHSIGIRTCSYELIEATTKWPVCKILSSVKRQVLQCIVGVLQIVLLQFSYFFTVELLV